MTTNILRWGQRTLQLLQQRDDESTFFGQKGFGAHEARVVPCAVFVTIRRQNRCTHSERSRRLDAGYARLADCG